MEQYVTVIPYDGIVSVNGESLIIDSVKEETFHALQWYIDKGHVEIDNKTPNEELTTDDYNTRVLPFVTLWEEEKKRIEEEEQENTPTEEELEALEAESKSYSILTAALRKNAAQTMSFTSEEFTTFCKAGLFDEWKAGDTYSAGYRLVYKNIVYEVIQEVTAIENQPPDAEGMLAIYRPLSTNPDTGVEPDGSKENPYTFIYGMDVENNKYYTYNGKLYLAKASMPACVWYPGTESLWQWEEVQTV